MASEFTIIQVTTDNIHSDHIHEKLPILIHDTIVDPKELIQTVFKYYFASIKEIDPAIIQNPVSHTFYIVHAKENTSISIRHPNYKTFLNVKLSKHNILLVPFKWFIKIDSPKQIKMFLGDSLLFKLFCLH